MRSKFALAAIAAAGLMSAGSAAALAAPAQDTTPRDTTTCTSDGNCAGSAKFTRKGDKLEVRDHKKDGYGVYVEYERGDTGARGDFAATGGKGDTKAKNLDLPEGTEISYYVCLYEYGGSTSSCSDWQYDKA